MGVRVRREAGPRAEPVWWKARRLDQLGLAQFQALGGVEELGFLLHPSHSLPATVRGAWLPKFRFSVCGLELHPRPRSEEGV